VQDGERARIGVDRHTEGAVGGDVTVGCMIAFALNSSKDQHAIAPQPDGHRVRATRAAHAGSPWSWAIAFTKR
jgi:hypothetical protein